MIFICVLLLIIAAESIIKTNRETYGKMGKRQLILGGKLYLTKYHNYGVFLNMGEKRPWLVKSVSFALTLICTTLFVLTLGNKGGLLLKTALAILLGGAYSNTYDRMVRGYVVDYFGFHVKNKKIRNVVYNISDFCIVIGALLAVLSENKKVGHSGE
ncbi:MAG: signal peptidase II [Lachnospiraceae bacterium]|nr:signal peptidase II [Lachnospiraceae bacterium]